MSRTYTIEEIKSIVSDISDCELLSTEYTGVYSKLRFRCSCGKDFEKAWNHFRYDRYKGCPDCARKKSGADRRLSEDKVREKLRSVGCEYLGGYRNNRSDMRVRFRCGHEGTARLNTLMHPGFKGDCFDCAHVFVQGHNRLLREEVAEKCLALGVELVSETYVSAKTPIQLRCLCGTVFTTTWDVVKQMGKTRCDRCTGLQSRGANAIERWLTENGFPVKKEKTFPGCVSSKHKRLRFDFYLPEQDTCIEYDGQQHFKVVDFGGTHAGVELSETLRATRENDIAKDVWCARNGKTLLRIRYDETDNISSILSRMLIPR